MNRPKNFRVYFLVAALAVGGMVLLLREHRPSFLRPDLHLLRLRDGKLPMETSRWSIW